jgi:hypothetical protein
MSGSEVLERRYRRLMVSYPADYRRSRGPEVLETLMEAASPGQRWPAGRESRALVLGGLRARTGADSHRSRTQVWLGSIRLAVLVLLAGSVARALVVLGEVAPHGLRQGLRWDGAIDLLAATVVLLAGALVAVAGGRPLLGLGLTVAGLAVDCQAPDWNQMWLPDAMGFAARSSWAGSWSGLISSLNWEIPVAAVLVLPLLWRRPAAVVRPWRWLAAVPVAALILPTGLVAGGHPDVLVGVLVLVALVWCVVDARVPLAAAAVLAAQAMPVTVLWVMQQAGVAFSEPAVSLPGVSGTLSPATVIVAIEAALATMLLTVGARRTRHETTP